MNDLGSILGVMEKYTLSYSVSRPIMRHILNNFTQSIATAMNYVKLSKLHSPD